METANAWGKRHRDCGIRAGLFPPPTVHDWRANSLYLIGISLAQLPVFVHLYSSIPLLTFATLAFLFSDTNFKSPIR